MSVNGFDCGQILYRNHSSVIKLFYSFTMAQFSRSSCAKYIVARQSLSFLGLINCQEGSCPADNWSTSDVVMCCEWL